MSEFKLSFRTDNEAFSTPETKDGPAESAPYAVAEILRDVTTMVEEAFTSGPLRDANGAAVGHWDWT